MLCRFLPSILAVPWIGKVMNRFSTLKVLIVSDVLLGLFYSLFLYADQVLEILVLQILISLGTAFYRPGRVTMITQIVPEEQLARANSYVFGISQFMMLLGPAVGGLAFGFFGLKVGIVLNTATFWVSALALLMVRVQPQASTTSDETKESRAEMEEPKLTFKEKFAALMSIPGYKLMMFIVLADIIGSMGFGALNVLFPIVADQVFGSPQEAYGYLMSALGGGLFLGTMYGPNLQKKISSELAFILSMIFGGLFAIGFGISSHLFPSLVLILLVGFGNGIQDNALVTYVQKATAEKGDTANVFSIYQGLISATIAVAMIGSTSLVSFVGIHATIVLLGFLPFVIGTGVLLAKAKWGGRKSAARTGSEEERFY